MKNLKSKLSMLVSISLLGAMLTAPCASATTTGEADENTITWKTLYEQDFSESGLTLDKLAADGWTFSGGASMQTDANTKIGYLRVGRVITGDNLSGSAVFGKDLGGTYRVTAKVKNDGNGFDLKFGGTATLTIAQKMTFGTVSTNNDEETESYRSRECTVTVTANNGTADMKISSNGIEDQTITNVAVPTSGGLGLYSNVYWTYGDNLYNIKIEVPADYVEYKTTYTQSASTTEQYTEQGWIYGLRGTTEGTIEIDTDRDNALVIKPSSSTGQYIIYNKNLGTDYIVDTMISAYSNEIELYFNATFDESYAPTSGFKIKIASDGKTYTLYKVGDNTALRTGTTEKSGTWNVYEFQIAYKNGNISINSSNGASISYDATNDIQGNSALASGLIGQSYSDKAYANQRKFTVKQPSTENELGVLCASYAASETAKTVR